MARRRGKLYMRTEIGHTKIRVYLVNQAEYDGHPCDGTTETLPDGTLRVELSSGLSRDIRDQTLTHELIHCCEAVLGFQLPERVVHLLGVGLHDAKINRKR